MFDDDGEVIITRKPPRRSPRQAARRATTPSSAFKKRSPLSRKTGRVNGVEPRATVPQAPLNFLLQPTKAFNARTQPPPLTPIEEDSDDESDWVPMDADDELAP